LRRAASVAYRPILQRGLAAAKQIHARTLDISLVPNKQETEGSDGADGLENSFQLTTLSPVNFRVHRVPLRRLFKSQSDTQR
jgi:hypothetical protein